MSKFLDDIGLAHLWGKIKTYVANSQLQWTKDYTTTNNNGVIQNDLTNNASGNTAGTPVGYAYASGYNTQALGAHSHTEGVSTTVYSPNGHAEGNNTTVGESSNPSQANSGHAEGRNTNAKGNASHAEGQTTTAIGVASHAECQGTTANGQASHAEGWMTTTTGQASHSEGWNTRANATASHSGGGNNDSNSAHSHTMGSNLIANGHSQCVVGTGNIADTAMTNEFAPPSQWMFIVGNGRDTVPVGEVYPIITDADRSNAMTVSRTGVVTATSFDNTSDERLKENFAEMDVQSAFMALEPVTFDWKEERPDGGKNMNNDGKRHFGLKAQQVESVLADNGFTDYGIVKDSGEYKTIAYTELIPMCIKMIQDQQKEIEKLKYKLNDR